MAGYRRTGLKPAMTLTSDIIGVQPLKAGAGVGYGYRYHAQAEQRIGVVACGYADGYPRHAPTGTPVMVDGVRTHTLGAVSMDMLMVDLTPCPQAGIDRRSNCGAIRSKLTRWPAAPAPLAMS